MENTLENKAKFLLCCYTNDSETVKSKLGKGIVFAILDIINNPEQYFAELTPLFQITDEDLIHVARLAHERPTHDFKVTRNKNIFYAQTEADSIGIDYFISMMPKYGTVCATMGFSKTKDEKYKTSTINIGKINLSSERPVAYIAIVDYLRSKRYALPWNGVSVETQIEYGWTKLKTEN